MTLTSRRFSWLLRPRTRFGIPSPISITPGRPITRCTMPICVKRPKKETFSGACAFAMPLSLGPRGQLRLRGGTAIEGLLVEPARPVRRADQRPAHVAGVADLLGLLAQLHELLGL